MNPTPTTTSSAEPLRGVRRALAWTGLATGTLRDVRFAALVGLLLAVSPATGAARWWLSALLGAFGGCVTYVLRVRQRAREGPAAAPAPGPALAIPAPAVWVVLGAMLLLFAPTLVWLFEEYTKSVWRNVHGLFVPFFMFWMGRGALRRDPAPGESTASAWGFAFLVPGIALVALDSGIRSHYLSALGLVLTLPGLSLLLLGARRTRLLAAPLTLGLFLLPIPPGLADPIGLTNATATLADPISEALGVPVVRHRTVFSTRHGLISVSQNCSGISTLYAAAALGFVLAWAARGWARKLVILVPVYGLTLVANSLRCVAILALVDRFGSGFLHTALHGFSGLLVLWSVLAGLAMLADRPRLHELLR